jgi:hypothetical protein
MDDNRLNSIKYSQFVSDPAYATFLYILNREIAQLVEQMINEPDKDKLLALQKQIQILNKLPDLIKSRIEQN